MAWKFIINCKKIGKMAHYTSAVNAIYINKRTKYVPLYR